MKAEAERKSSFKSFDWKKVSAWAYEASLELFSGSDQMYQQCVTDKQRCSFETFQSIINVRVKLKP